jgi:hypothetical protein
VAAFSVRHRKSAVQDQMASRPGICRQCSNLLGRSSTTRGLVLAHIVYEECRAVIRAEVCAYTRSSPQGLFEVIYSFSFRLFELIVGNSLFTFDSATVYVLDAVNSESQTGK